MIESPFAGSTPAQVEANVAYAKRCLLDTLHRGEAGFASHLLYTQVLIDTLPDERTLGIAAGLRWAETAHLTAVYFDLGVSSGMLKGIQHAQGCGRPIVYRSLEGKTWLHSLGDPSEITEKKNDDPDSP